MLAVSLLLGGVAAAAPPCKPFCARKTHSWPQLCNWNGCEGCTECSTLPSVPPADPPPPELPPPCMHHCPFMTHPWSERCEWTGCRGCSECSGAHAQQGDMGKGGGSMGGDMADHDMGSGDMAGHGGD